VYDHGSGCHPLLETWGSKMPTSKVGVEGFELIAEPVMDYSDVMFGRLDFGDDHLLCVVVEVPYLMDAPMVQVLDADYSDGPKGREIATTDFIGYGKDDEALYADYKTRSWSVLLASLIQVFRHFGVPYDVLKRLKFWYDIVQGELLTTNWNAMLCERCGRDGFNVRGSGLEWRTRVVTGNDKCRCFIGSDSPCDFPDEFGLTSYFCECGWSSCAVGATTCDCGKLLCHRMKILQNCGACAMCVPQFKVVMCEYCDPDSRCANCDVIALELHDSGIDEEIVSLYERLNYPRLTVTARELARRIVRKRVCKNKRYSQFRIDRAIGRSVVPVAKSLVESRLEVQRNRPQLKLKGVNS